jgi:hypothetical protein
MAPPRALTYVWYVALLLLSYTHAAREEPVGGTAVASPPYDNPTAMQVRTDACRLYVQHPALPWSQPDWWSLGMQTPVMQTPVIFCIYHKTGHSLANGIIHQLWRKNLVCSRGAISKP